MSELYPPPVFTDDNADDNEQHSDNESLNEEEQVPKRTVKKGRKRSHKKSEEDAAKLLAGKRTKGDDFAADFHFDLGEGEAREDASDLDGLRAFLKQNSQNSEAATKFSLAERVQESRKKNRNNATSSQDSDDSAAAANEDEITKLGEEDKLRFKQLKKKRTKDEEFFDANSQKIVRAASAKQSSFDDLNLSRSILKAVFEAGFQQPTPIQKACIPVALAGRDICACSATGTGKTAAFMLPILERLLYKSHKQKGVTKVLVLVPTRELAIQVFQVSRKLAKYTGVELCLAAGGLDVKAQAAALRLGLDIVIATPGRLIDHLHNAPNFSLAHIEVLVLDEADRILEEQFMEQMKEIIKLCARNRQTMLFSATLTEEVEELAKLSLNKPVKLFINENTDMASNLHQEFVRIRNEGKGGENEESRREAIIAALVTRTFPDHTIIFMRTKRACERMFVLLGLLGVRVGQLHGGLTQLQRVEMLHQFKRQAEVRVLCATDLAARGLDIEGVLTVINMHMPNTVKQYVHRVGRTARAGNAGRSISLVGEQERKLMREVLKTNRTENGKSLAAVQRTIAPSTIATYMKKIEQLQPTVNKILEDQKFERSQSHR